MVGVRATSRASATYVVAPAALAGVLALATAVAWGDVGHAHASDEGTRGSPDPYCLAGAVYALAFLTFYAYFSRVESARALAVRGDGPPSRVQLHRPSRGR